MQGSQPRRQHSSSCGRVGGGGMLEAVLTAEDLIAWPGKGQDASLVSSGSLATRPRWRRRVDSGLAGGADRSCPDRRAVAFEGCQVQAEPRDNPIALKRHDVFHGVNRVATWTCRRAAGIVCVQPRPTLVVKSIADRDRRKGAGRGDDGDGPMRTGRIAKLKAVFDRRHSFSVAMRSRCVWDHAKEVLLVELGLHRLAASLQVAFELADRIAAAFDVRVVAGEQVEVRARLIEH